MQHDAALPEQLAQQRQRDDALARPGSPRDDEHLLDIAAAGLLDVPQDQAIRRLLFNDARQLRQRRYEDAVANGDAVLPPLSAQPPVDRRAADTAALLALTPEREDEDDEVDDTPGNPDGDSGDAGGAALLLALTADAATQTDATGNIYAGADTGAQAEQVADARAEPARAEPVAAGGGADAEAS